MAFTRPETHGQSLRPVCYPAAGGAVCHDGGLELRSGEQQSPSRVRRGRPLPSAFQACPGIPARRRTPPPSPPGAICSSPPPAMPSADGTRRAGRPQNPTLQAPTSPRPGSRGPTPADTGAIHPSSAQPLASQPSALIAAGDARAATQSRYQSGAELQRQLISANALVTAGLTKAGLTYPPETTPFGQTGAEESPHG